MDKMIIGKESEKRRIRKQQSVAQMESITHCEHNNKV